MKRIIVKLLLILIAVIPGSVLGQSSETKNATTLTKTTYNSSYFARTPEGKLMLLLIQEYQTALLQNTEVTDVLSKLTDLRRQLNTNDKAEFNEILYKSYYNACSTNDIFGMKASANLYKFFAEENDNKLPEILFCIGDLAANEPFDTIEIKQCIFDLYVYQNLTNQSQEERISKLDHYLNSIRNLKPLTQDIDGIWVSSLFDPKTGLPFFILKISDSGSTVEMSKISYYERSRSLNAKSEYAQEKKDLGVNTAYFLFASENAKTIDPYIQAFTHGVASDLGYRFTSRLTNEVSDGYSGELLSGMTSGLIQLGTDALLDKIFTPTKKIYLSHLWLHKVNPNLLVAECKNRYVFIEGESQPDIQDMEYQNVKFMRWTPESGICFAADNIMDIQMLDLSQENGGSHGQTQKLKSDRNWRFRGDYLLLDKTHNFRTYNYLMVKNLIYRVEQDAVNRGWPILAEDEKYNKVAYLGASFKEMNATKVKGVYIEFVDKDSPALLFGLCKGDIITAIDNYPMIHSYEVTDFLATTPPYSIIRISLIHKGKKKKVPVTVSFQYVLK